MTSRTLLIACMLASVGLGAEVEAAQVYWRAEQGEEVTTLQVAPSTTFVATGGYGGSASARLWDARNGQLIADYPGHEHGVIKVAISPDEELLAVGHVYVDFYHGIARTKVYEISTGALLHQFGGAFTDFPAAGTRIACGGGLFNRSIGVYELPSGAEIADIYTGDYVWDMAISPDGEMVATCAGESQIVLWDVGTGDEIRRLQNSGGGIGALAFSVDGSLIAGGVAEQYAAARIDVWRIEDGAHVQGLAGHESGVVNDLDFTPGGGTLISSGRDVPVGGDHSVRLWSIEDGSQLAFFPFAHRSYGVAAVDVAPNGAGAVLGLGNGGILAAGTQP